MKRIHSGQIHCVLSLCSFAIVFLIPFCVSSQADEAAVESRLRAMPDVKIIGKSVTYQPYRLEYQLAIRQPLDHNDTSKGFFYQQLRLAHTDFSRPMVMETEGYSGRAPGSELQKILACNDMDVEFRYFNNSKPDSLQWQYLTFEQAVADLHHIRESFGSLYHGKWLSTGISRGGETTLIYRYFYPNDVDASIPYVAPMPNDIEDKRIYAFLDTAGGMSCVKKIRNVQTFLLQHEEEALQKLPISEKILHYSFVGGIGRAFEYTVLEYPFSFWQISTLTEKDIPNSNNLDTILNHIYKVFGGLVFTFSDEENQAFAPHYYMTYQTGYYKYDIKPFEKFLHYLTGPNPTAVCLPPNVPRKGYEPDFEAKINAWLFQSGNNIIYIYGGRDTWSACAAALSNDVNAKRFFIPGANHRYARIRNMPPAMQQQFRDALESMTGLKADLSTLKPDKLM